MNFRDLLADDDAVSPVIGVILMVAITVILAAVIGTFVLGLGDQVSQSQPSANVGFAYGNLSDSDNFNDVVTITHKGGDKLIASDLNITVGGTGMYDAGSLVQADLGGTAGADILSSADGATNNWGDSSITAGDQLVIEERTGPNQSDDVFGNGDTVRVIWSADNGDTAIIAEGTVQ